ncbi:hypothetical protein [Pseudomonas sp. 24 E 13]|nr:hypothetical protein [Pseudomonas sp. 24 E 13]
MRLKPRERHLQIALRLGAGQLQGEALNPATEHARQGRDKLHALWAAGEEPVGLAVVLGHVQGQRLADRRAQKLLRSPYFIQADRVALRLEHRAIGPQQRATDQGQ